MRSKNADRECELCGQLVTTNGQGRASHQRTCMQRKLQEIAERRVSSNDRQHSHSHDRSHNRT